MAACAIQKWKALTHTHVVVVALAWSPRRVSYLFAAAPAAHWMPCSPAFSPPRPACSQPIYPNSNWRNVSKGTNNAIRACTHAKPPG